MDETKRLAQALDPNRAELRAYQPTLRDRIASFFVGDERASPEKARLVEGLLGSRGLGNTGMGLVDLTPAGAPLWTQEFKRAQSPTEAIAAALNFLPGAKGGKAVAGKLRDEIAEAISKGEFANYGLRVTDEPLTVGHRAPPSRVWDNGEPTEEMLRGPSVFQIRKDADIDKALEAINAYHGGHVSLIGSDVAEGGADVGEAVLGQSNSVLSNWAKPRPFEQDAVKNMAPEAGSAVKSFFKAYHGSPHDFDRFSLDKIGTGEGAQAYGHGLYFAESEGVAKSYRDNLSPPIYSPADEAADFELRMSGGNREEAIAGLRASAARSRSVGSNDMAVMNEEAARLLESGDWQGPRQSAGRMYEVNINADPEHFLDWDKPLAEQSEKVRKAVENASLYPAEGTGRDIIDNWASYDRAAHGDNAKARVTERLREAGIPGIRYLDQGSRGAGEGSSNYVVFDDKLIEILKKYGLVGTAGPALMANALLSSGQPAPDETY
jgi:hypothetical protein